jgi:hypothetical protein
MSSSSSEKKRRQQYGAQKQKADEQELIPTDRTFAEASCQ